MKCWIFLVVTLMALSTYAQVQHTGNLLAHVEAIVEAMPLAGGGEYEDPDAADLLAWEVALGHIKGGSYEEAHAVLQSINYQLLILQDTSFTVSRTYYILERESGTGNYWGTYVFYPASCRTDIVIQSPHPRYDLNTGSQGAYIFRNMDAYAFFMSGTHRCNASLYAACSGTTSACGATEAFRVSDMAHNDQSLFQLSTQWMYTENPGTYFVQLHGFAKAPIDPDLIMSNGTRITPNKDYIATLQEALTSIDPLVTMKAAHLDFDWDDLLAFTNTQGRLINNSLDPCTQSATNTQGQFIHLEQSFNKFRVNATAWDLMAEALKLTFPCPGVVTQIDHNNANMIRVFPNPTNNAFNISIPGEWSQGILRLFDAQGREIRTSFLESENEFQIGEEFLSGMYFFVWEAGERRQQLKLIKR